MPPPLGRNQLSFLHGLITYGPYHQYGFWIWSTHSATMVLAESLKKRGLVRIRTLKRQTRMSKRSVIQVEITKAGRDTYASSSNNT
jgi:hypothetical protein